MLDLKTLLEFHFSGTAIRGDIAAEFELKRDSMGDNYKLTGRIQQLFEPISTAAPTRPLNCSSTIYRRLSIKETRSTRLRLTGGFIFTGTMGVSSHTLTLTPNSLFQDDSEFEETNRAKNLSCRVVGNDKIASETEAYKKHRKYYPLPMNTE